AGDLRLQDPAGPSGPDRDRKHAGDRTASDVPLQVREARDHASERPVRTPRCTRERGVPGQSRSLVSRLRTVCFLALVALTAAVSASAAGGSIHVTEAGGSGFPGRAYVLTVPKGMELKAGQVHVTENGTSVDGVTVVPVAQAHPEDFGVVLLVDASTSMEGKPERAAYAAARAFAAQRAPQEQLALLTYNLTPTFTLPFTTEQAPIDKALSKQPTFAYGTHIYDAVVESLRQLRAADIKVGTLVVLSDGQEQRGHNYTAKHETEESAASAARAAHVRVFAVGLTSRLSHLAALKQLARDTGGTYVETKSIKKLTSIYNQLGSQLASEYLIRYQSLAGPGKNIAVKVRVDGVPGVAETAYQTPKLTVAVAGPKAPYHPAFSTRLWDSALTMTFIGL